MKPGSLYEIYYGNRQYLVVAITVLGGLVRVMPIVDPADLPFGYSIDCTEGWMIAYLDGTAWLPQHQVGTQIGAVNLTTFEQLVLRDENLADWPPEVSELVSFCQKIDDEIHRQMSEFPPLPSDETQKVGLTGEHNTVPHAGTTNQPMMSSTLASAE